MKGQRLERNRLYYPYSKYTEGPTFETLDFTVCIGSTPTFLYFDLYISTLPRS